MEATTLSALAALTGAAVGGVTSIARTWLSQHAQARIQKLTYQLNKREELYNAFIEEVSKLYGDALVHELSDVSKLVELYAMIAKMRVLSVRTTVDSANEVARLIVNTYRAPNKSLPELQDMVNRGAIDVLQTFSEAARQEFHSLRV
jgi:hypothetical protein